MKKAFCDCFCSSFAAFLCRNLESIMKNYFRHRRALSGPALSALSRTPRLLSGGPANTTEAETSSFNNEEKVSGIIFATRNNEFKKN